MEYSPAAAPAVLMSCSGDPPGLRNGVEKRLKVKDRGRLFLKLLGLILNTTNGLKKENICSLFLKDIGQSPIGWPV